MPIKLQKSVVALLYNLLWDNSNDKLSQHLEHMRFNNSGIYYAGKEW